MSGIPHGYKMTDVGVIPEGWQVVEIGDLNPFVTSGSRGWARYYSEHGSPFVRITNLTRESIYLNLHDLKYVMLPEDATEGIRTQLHVNDLLISITADIGIIGYVTSELPEPAYINQHIALVRFDPEKVDSKFISYFLASETPQKLFRAMTDQGAKAGMSLITIRNIRLVLPTLKEQHAIAEVLSDIDAQIAALDALIAKKRDIKQSAMQELLTGKKRLPGFSGEWELLNMAEKSKLKARIGWQGLTTAEYQKTGDYYLVTGTDFVNGRIEWNRSYFVDKQRFDQDKNIQLKVGDVLLTKDGTIGKVAYIDFLPAQATLNSGVFVIRPIGEAYHSQFLYYILTSRIFSTFLSQLQAGSTINHLYQKDFVAFGFFAPSLSEQEAIAKTLYDMDAEISTLEVQREKTVSLKQGTMQELLTGKTRLI